VTALDAAAAAGVDRCAGLRVLDAFAAAARGAHATTREALAVLPPSPGAAAVAPLSRAAALLRRGALAGADVTDVHTCADARALVLAARAACDVVVEVRRRAAVVFFYGGDGAVHTAPRSGNLYVRYGGNEWRDTSPLIDQLRALYDYVRAKRRDDIEQLARDLYARGMGRLVAFLGGLVAGQRAVVVWRLVPNIVGGRVEIKFQASTPSTRLISTQVAEVLAGEELLVRCVVEPGDVTDQPGVAYSHDQLRGHVSLVNVFARARGCYELSRAASTGEPVDLAICGIDVKWMDDQQHGLVDEEWVLRGNCGGDVYWQLDGDTRWRAATRRHTVLGDAEYLHFQRLYDVVRVKVRYAVPCESLAEASALLAKAARVTVADYQDALAACQSGQLARELGLRRGVADLWNVAEVVASSEPLIDTAARLIVAGAFDLRGVDLEEAVARSRVLEETVARTLSVDASTVTVVTLNAANDEDATALGAARSVEDLLRAIPMAGGTNALDATTALLRDHFAAPAPAPAPADDDATAAPGLLDSHRVFLAKKGSVRDRCEAMVLRLGGAVVGANENPTLAVLGDNFGEGGGSRSCETSLKRLRPLHMIVRERWLHRLDGVAPGAELPDTKPDAVFALVRDLKNPASYWYDADAATRGRLDDQWLLTRRAWTPSAQAGGAG